MCEWESRGLLKTLPQLLKRADGIHEKPQSGIFGTMAKI
jgi:hypothetical protein